jgi:hypothetical protein
MAKPKKKYNSKKNRWFGKGKIKFFLPSSHSKE